MFPIGMRLARNYPTPSVLLAFFDYPSLVQWSSGSFEVGITLVLSSFRMVNDGSTHLLDVTIAKWNGAGYSYSGTNRLVLQKDALYGPNCPFSQYSTFNVVRLYGRGSQFSLYVFYIIFHKIETSGPIKTGFGVVRTRDRDNTMGPYSDNIADPNYNVAITDPSAVRIYGFESF